MKLLGAITILGMVCLAVAMAAPPPASVLDTPQDLPVAFKKTAPENVEDLRAIQEQVKEVLKKTIPATVAIVIPDPKGKGVAAGSGVIISEDGYVLTAGHISQKPNERCTLILPDGKRLRGETLGWNKSRDAGLIKITEKGKKWPFIKMGDSSKVKAADWVLTVGHPGGYKPGRPPVVRLGRVMLNSKQWIQTDTPLVGGDSGGPLFDLNGNVIGIHSWISQSINGNMHVPVNIYKDDWDRLARGDEWGTEIGGKESPPRRAYLGVAFDPDTDDLKISDVYRRTPAARAGLKVGDVLLSVDGRKLTRRDDLMNYLMRKRPGQTVTFEVARDGSTVSVEVELGRPRDEE